MAAVADPIAVGLVTISDAMRASSGSIMGPRGSIYGSIPKPRVLQRFASALVHVVSRQSLLFMACTRRKVYLSSWQYVRELQATKEESFMKKWP
jgi:hypothetical protein